MSTLQRKTPCHDCPYRRNAPAGWLGADSPVPFVAKSWIAEMDMPCHTAIDYTDPDWLRTQEPGAPMCAGALIMMRNGCKLPRDPRMSDDVRGVERSPKVFANPAEFLTHHDKREWSHRDADEVMRAWVIQEQMREKGIEDDE